MENYEFNSKQLFESLDEQEFSPIVKHQAKFDQTRHAVRQQAIEMFFGKGGDSYSEANQTLNMLLNDASTSFAEYIEALTPEYPDLEMRIAIACDQYLGDEAQRIERFKTVRPDVACPATQLESISEQLEDIYGCEDEALRHNRLAHIYKQSFAADVSNYALPPNAHELAVQQREARKQRLARAALDVGRIAIVAGVASLISHHYRKK